MMRTARPGSVSLPLFIWALLLFCPVLHAQQDCNAEVKVLLSQTETQAAVATLGAGNQKSGRVYFFDTDALDLLSQGAIVRLQLGTRSDLTVKLRPPNGKEFSPSSGESLGFKCEVELTGGGKSSSYSITRPFVGKQIPATGYDVSQLLSSGQMKLINDAHISVDWSRVKRLPEITSTDWQIRAQPPFRKLSLELWEWPGGKILELSTKTPSESTSSTYSELQQLVKTKHLSLSPEQNFKTTTALHAMAPR